MIRSELVTRLVQLALDEDLGLGDVTSTVAIPDGHQSKASLIAKEDFVFCAAGIVEEILRIGKSTLEVSRIVPDGSLVKKGASLLDLEGSTAEILSLERTILNFVQRLSGVATKTKAFVDTAGSVRILDTRKTTPGWRLLEKYAVTVGGAHNHRMNLSDLILIKNNHIDAYKGDIEALFKSVERKRPPYVPMEVEVRTQDELTKVLAFSTPDIIMLDNMDNDGIAASVKQIQAKNNQIKIEVSGGITEERLKTLSQYPVFVSVGALTTQARAVDISLRIHEPS